MQPFLSFKFFRPMVSVSLSGTFRTTAVCVSHGFAAVKVGEQA
jgi:hypothetical protein